MVHTGNIGADILHHDKYFACRSGRVVCRRQVIQTRIVHRSHFTVSGEPARAGDNRLQSTDKDMLTILIHVFDAENSSAQLVFANDVHDFALCLNRHAKFFSFFGKYANIVRTFTSGCCMRTRPKSAVNLKNLGLEFNAFGFKPLQCVVRVVSERVDQIRITAEITAFERLLSVKFGAVFNALFFLFRIGRIEGTCRNRSVAA